MEEQSNDILVLGAIKRGAKKIDKIRKITNLSIDEINQILEKLEERGFIENKEKKGFFGKKIEITLTDKGDNELEHRLYELQQEASKMEQLYKSGNKQALQQYMDDNKGILPMMMFFGIMDMMMFSMMFSMIGMSMHDYVPPEHVPDGYDNTDAGTDMSDGGTDMGDGGFDIDIGF